MTWDTTTRSAPLITKVPESVMSGKSPMKISCSLMTPVSLFSSCTVTLRGAAYVASRALHSSMEYLGLSFIE